MKPAHIAVGSAVVGAGISAFTTLLMLAGGIDATAGYIILGVQVLLAIAIVIIASRPNRPKQASRPQPPAQPPLQPVTTALQPVGGSVEDMIIRLPNRPQPPATAPQPPATAPQPQPQPPHEPVIMPFPLQNGQRHEPRPRAEVPWQPAPWDVLLDEQRDATGSTSDGSAGDADEQPAAVCLLPLRPPTVGDYEVIREALKVCQWSRRRACVVVYGRRDGLSYPWLRKVADYWEIAEADRPSILAWELIGTDEIPGNLAIRLGLDLTPDQLEAAIDAANLTRCPECDRWATLDELDETDACTRCTA